MDNTEKAVKMLDRVLPQLPDAMRRFSARGVPHLVVDLGFTKLSVCWFGSTQTFRTFYPWPSYDQKQTKRTWTRKKIGQMVKYVWLLKEGADAETVSVVDRHSTVENLGSNSEAEVESTDR